MPPTYLQEGRGVNKRLLGVVGEQACGPRGQWVHRAPEGNLHGLTTCSSALAYRNQGGHPRGEEGSALPAVSWHPRGPVPTEARPKGEEFGFCQNARPEDLEQGGVSLLGLRSPWGLTEPLCPLTARRGSERTRGQEGSREKAPGARVVHGTAGRRRESPECQTQRSEFIRKPSGATEGFSIGEGRGQLSLTGGRTLEGRPA